MTVDLAALTLPLTAMITGFLGSVHCLGMCGGVSGTIALAARTQERSPIDTSLRVDIPVVTIPGKQVKFSSPIGVNVLAFNGGRIASYAVAGAIAGGAGGLLNQAWLVGDSFNARTALFLLANSMIVLTGLYLMGLPQLLAPLEHAGGRIWRHVSPLTRAFLPMDTAPRAVLFGAIWGWIPCGLVYAMLLTAMAAGSTAAGAATMLAFGIGTLPAMVLAGLAAGSLRRWTRDNRVRLAAGTIIVTLGLLGFARADSLASLQAFGAFCVSAVTT